MSASTFDAATQDRKKTLDIRWTDRDGQFNDTWTYGQLRGREDGEIREKKKARRGLWGYKD
jgi:hypothetical protein